MKQTILVLIIFSLLVAFLPFPVYGIILVPCGRAEQKGTADEQCQLRHLIMMITRLINYLISLASLVAMYQVLFAGFSLVKSLGNPELIKTARTGLSNAVVGFGIVVLAFVFVNLLLNGLLGKPGAERRWWNPECIYGIASSEKCPLGISEPLAPNQ